MSVEIPSTGVYIWLGILTKFSGLTHSPSFLPTTSLALRPKIIGYDETIEWSTLYYLEVSRSYSLFRPKLRGHVGPRGIRLDPRARYHDGPNFSSHLNTYPSLSLCFYIYYAIHQICCIIDH